MARPGHLSDCRGRSGPTGRGWVVGGGARTEPLCGGRLCVGNTNSPYLDLGGSARRVHRGSAASLVLSMDLPAGTLCGRRQLLRTPMGAASDEIRFARAVDRLADPRRCVPGTAPAVVAGSIGPIHQSVPPRGTTVGARRLDWDHPGVDRTAAQPRVAARVVRPDLPIGGSAKSPVPLGEIPAPDRPPGRQRSSRLGSDRASGAASRPGRDGWGGIGLGGVLDSRFGCTPPAPPGRP